MLPPISWVLIGVVIGSVVTTVVNICYNILYPSSPVRMVDRVEQSIIVES